MENSETVLGKNKTLSHKTKHSFNEEKGLSLKKSKVPVAKNETALEKIETELGKNTTVPEKTEKSLEKTLEGGGKLDKFDRTFGELRGKCWIFVF